MSNPDTVNSDNTHSAALIDEQELNSLLKLSQSAALLSGRLLVERMGKARVREKNPGDYVTEADIESQKLIEKTLLDSYPEHGFLGEESTQLDNSNESTSKEFCWIVDPLDGTTNYIHQLNSFSVSIALKHRNKIVLGTVHDPVLNETYSACIGGGATLNGQPIRVSRCEQVDHSLLVCSLPGRNRRDSVEVERFLNVLCDTGATLRRLGSAALNLCYLAAGRLDGYWATSINIWDIAAGLVILREAGGAIHHIDGGPFRIDDPRFVATANQRLFQQLRPQLVRPENNL